MKRYKRFFKEGVITTIPAKNTIYFAINKEGTDALIGFYNGAISTSQLKSLLSQIRTHKGTYNLANPLYPVSGKINSLRGMRVLHISIQRNPLDFEEAIQNISSKIKTSLVKEPGLLYYFKDYTGD